MDRVSGWDRLGLQMKLRILIQGCMIIVMVAAQYWILSIFEQDTMKAAKEKAEMVANGVINGLNTLMVTKIGSEDVISDQASRKLFIQKMGDAEKVREARVIRSKILDQEFSSGLPEEQPVDELDRSVLSSGKIESRLINDGTASLRTVVPFIAKKNFRGTNCLKCHDVPEGTVLGASSIIIDIDEDMATLRRINLNLWLCQGILHLILFFVIGYIVNTLLKQLGGEPEYVIKIVKRIACGNLSEKISTRAGDSSSLLAAMQQMQASLREIIGNALQTADKVTNAARMLAGSSHEVLSASENQSVASAAVATSVGKMTAGIAHIANNATDAQIHSVKTGDLAKQGASAVREVVIEMDKIYEAVSISSQSITALGEKSNQISNIVQVIKEIAEQTNLLALNAAIEAARAGEQGRGFAVVADEVRKLAERTSHSTREIATMIESIQSGTTASVDEMSQGNKRVSDGVKIVRVAGSAMDQIQAGVHQVLASMADISSALREQNSTSQQITHSIGGIAAMTEKTSNIVKEVSASADQLEKLAISLNESMCKFTL